MTPRSAARSAPAEGPGLAGELRAGQAARLCGRYAGMRLAHLTAAAVAIAIAAGAWLWSSGREDAPSADRVIAAVTDPIGEASRVAAFARVQAAATALEQLAARTGTYAGATVDALREVIPSLDPSVAVVTANDAGYCVQAGVGDAVAHVAGPGGAPGAGPCPR